MIGEIEILRHPVHACVPAGHTVVLSVCAQGTGALHFQWFNYALKDGAVREVPGGTQPNLTIHVERTQNYSCRVNDRYLNFRFSKWAQVSVLDADHSGLPLQWRGEPHITVQPQPQALRPGARLRLCCAAFGVPQPAYQWYRDGQALQQQTREILQVSQAGAHDAGTYLCAVTNVLGESWSDAVDVNLILSKPSMEVNTAALTATDKVALLIGNLNYSHHPGLLAPVMDVHELGLLLQQLGFRVLSLLDLTAEQMTAAVHNFTQLLDTGVYGLFYYAGHGFERAGRNYLVPIDAPQPYRTSTCLCVQRIMGKMQEKNTALSLILLDACRKWCKEESTLSIIQPLGPTGNTVYGYATGEDAEAFEVQDQSRSTGIFTKYLNKYILLPEKVTHVLERVSEDVDKDPLVRGKQAVEIRHSLKEARSLSDPIRSNGHTRELRARDVCWRRANELPKKKSLQFPCGAEVEVGFSALFSNVLVVFANVRRSGPQATDCTLGLSSHPAMENIFSGESRSEDFDSLLFGQSNNPESSLWLCGLQTLKEALLIHVDLHFTVADGDSTRRQTQSLQLNVGKPLVASCGLYHQSVSPKAHCPGAHGAHVPPQRSQATQPFSRKCLEPATVGKNQPEEHDESETML
ncbi:unnamed protein product [Knipowitschia caucasica]